MARVERLILDISGDQFGWPAVIVARISPLHNRGLDEMRHRWALEPGWWGQQCGGTEVMPRIAIEESSDDNAALADKVGRRGVERMMYRWPSCEWAGLMLPGYEDREIEASLDGRAAVPAGVFCYPAVESWRERIWHMLNDVITDDVRAEFVRDPPEYIVSDDLSWLDDIVFSVTGKVVDMKQLVATRLSGEFRAFRVAHGTRTNDLAQFYKEGLRRLRPEDIENRARELFLSGQFKFGTEERLQAAIDDLGARNDQGGCGGRLYFCADERSLVTRTGGSGHYLVYGSEYLYCLGIRVVTTSETKRVLKAIGRPTMLVCDIPMPLMQFHTLRTFGGMVIEYLFCELVDDPDCHALSPGAGSALSLIKDLAGEHIVGHYHPVSVYDPHWSH